MQQADRRGQLKGAARDGAGTVAAIRAGPAGGGVTGIRCNAAFLPPGSAGFGLHPRGRGNDLKRRAFHAMMGPVQTPTRGRDAGFSNRIFI